MCNTVATMWHAVDRYELLPGSPAPQLHIGRDRVSGDAVVLKRGEGAQLHTELCWLQCLAHPQLPRLHDVLWTPTGAALVLERREGCELRQWVRGGASVERACAAVLSLLTPLRLLHRLGIVHRDLKPEHVLVHGEPSDPTVSLVDLGLAASKGCETPAGTQGFIAPEVAAGAGAGASADSYAIGAILHEVLLGQVPDLLPAPADGQALFSHHAALPAALRELVGDLLATDAAARPSLSMVSEVLCHVLGREPPGAPQVPEQRARPLPLLQSRRQQQGLERAVESMLGGESLLCLAGELPPGALEALAQLAAVHDIQPLRLTSIADLEGWLGLEPVEIPAERRASRALEALLDRDREAALVLVCEALDLAVICFAEQLARVVHGDPIGRGADLELALVWRGDDPLAASLGDLGRRVSLRPLERLEVDELVRALVDREQVPRWSAALSSGSKGEPRRILAGLRAQLQGGVDAERLRPEAVAALGLESAIAGLDAVERELLATVALAAAPLSVARLAQVAPMAIAALGALGAHELIVLDARGVALAPGAELRELALAELDLDRRREIHRRLAEILAAADRHEVSAAVLGHHQLHAGRAIDAAETLLSCATAQREDLELCCEELARGGGAGADAALLVAVRRRLALERRAAGDLTGALSLAAACGEAGEQLAAELLLDAGQPAGALARLAGRKIDREPEAALLSARAKVLLGDVGGAVTDARRGLRRAEGEALRLRLENVLGLGLLYTGEVVAACETLEAALQRTAGASAELEEPRARLANSLGMGHQRRAHLDSAQRSYERALQGFRALGDLRLAATCALNLGTVAHQRGRLSAALAAYRRARDLAQRAELGTTLGWALANEGNLLLDLGACDEAERRLEAASARAEQLGGGGLAAHVALYRGDLARQRGEAEEAGTWLADARARFEAADVQGRQAAALLAGELALARRSAEAADVALKELLQLQGEASAAMLWLAARRQRLPGGSLHRADELVERALALEAPEPARFSLLAFAAENATQLGQPDRARQLAERASRELSQRRAAVPPQYRQRFDAHPEVRAARAGLGAAGGLVLGPAPAGIARLLEINRELNQRVPLEELLERILEGAIDLSGAERGFILLTGGREGRGKKLRLVAARSVEGERIRRGMAKLSMSIAEEAMSQQRTVLIADARQDKRFRARLSVSGLELVAVLCVPLSASGEPCGALYLDNRYRADVFSAETVALAEAFAEQAGIALVNARLLEQASRRGEQLAEAKAQLEQLNRRLEDELARQSAALSEMRVRLDHQEEELVRRFNAANLVGRSKPMRALFGQLERITRADLPVVIHGESGTGKELVARALHQQSPRVGEPFVAVNCGAIPATLLESELFGYVRGAFTGAVRDRPGMFEIAQEGTLFLDEVGDMDAEMQVKLLRILQEGTFRRLGEERERQSRCRVVSASHARLDALVAEGRFREDLFYRLHVLNLEVPALRERRDDIPLLIEHLLARLAAERGGPAVTLSRAALRALVDHRWPGNVRELENELSRAALLCEGQIELEDLSPAITRAYRGAAGERATAEVGAGGLRDALIAHERALIASTLRRCGDNVTRAAAVLKVHRVALHRKIRALGIQRNQEARS